MNIVLGILVGLIILVFLVVIHELGHAIVARRNGVVVEEFGIGFPPKAWAKKIKKSILGKNVLLSINWLPLGGFVKLKGEHDLAKGEGAYGAASFWAKTKILLAGVAVNWVMAAILLSVLAFIGIPKLIDGQFMVESDLKIEYQPVKVANITKESPAEKAGLKEGDSIISINDKKLLGARELTAITLKNKGKDIVIKYERQGTEKTTKVKLRPNNDDKKGYLGLAGSQDKATLYKSTWSSPVVGVALTGQLTTFSIKMIGQVLVDFVTGLVEKLNFSSDVRKSADTKLGAVGDNVGGPVIILGMLFPKALEGGLESLLLTTAMISLALAVMNLLPIPALDGGRWFVTFLYRKIFRKPLSKDKEEKIHGTGFLILMALAVLVTVSDVGKFFR